MDDMVGLGLLLLLVVLAVPVFLIIALMRIADLRQRVDALELAVQQGARAAVAPVADVPAFDTPIPAAPEPWAAPLPPIMEQAAAPPPMPERLRHLASARWQADMQTDVQADVQADEQAETAQASQPPPAPLTPSWAERAIDRIKLWFTTGNVPVKVGMVVLLAGVAALLRYASDQGWLRMPIELRLAGVSAAALAALVFAWKRRESHRSFALAVQGGAIGVLLLVTFAAFKLYSLLDAGPALAISVLLIAGMAVLAVLQESRTLAILGTLAGFLAPLWLSTGSGNHVGLFTYYAVLNAGIFAIAWVRPWRVLNLLGFAFTFGIGTLWGVLQYQPEKFASTEPFLLLFFGFYLLLPLLYARKAQTPGGARIDGSLLFGTPLIAFSLQAGLLQGERMPLALCALGLAVIYVLLARALWKHARLQLLVRGYAILAVGFATLAIPLALSARATASVFALEGAGLVWLGLSQQRRLPRWSGLGLQLAAAVALVFSSFSLANSASADVAIINPTFMSALLIALGGFATAWLYRRQEHTVMATAAYVWGLVWWLGNGGNEISNFVDATHRLHLYLLLMGVSGWLAAEVQRKQPAQALALTTLGALGMAFPLAFAQMQTNGQPFANYGVWVWPLFAILGLRSVWCLRNGGGMVAGLAQLVWWLLWPTVLSLLAAFIGTRFELAEGWVGMLLALPWLGLAALSLRRSAWLAMPLGEAFAPFQMPLRVLVFIALGLWWLWMLFSAGNSAPLPWLVVCNPLDLAQLAVLLLLVLWLRDGQDAQATVASKPVMGLALAGLLLVTVMTLRGVHHWGGQAWNDALVGTGLAQTSLTVVWSLLGVVGWVLGSRRGQWGLWLAGASLMGIVLLKLLLIDRGNLGDLLGIGAFIAYGLLCTLVGWLAPVPPRRVQASNNVAVDEVTA
jgi:uncharacterized membrane protein